MNAAIAAKDAEIASLRQNEAQLKAAADEQSRKMAALSADKDSLAALMEKTVSGKNRTIALLAVLLGLALIAAIAGIVRGRKKAAA
jgi:hypothetical protein